jgi:mono/diheme cytochrome c family protein
MPHFFNVRFWRLAALAVAVIVLVLLLTPRTTDHHPPPGIALESERSAAAESIATVERGREVMMTNCARCHGSDADHPPADTSDVVELATRATRTRFVHYGEQEFFCLMRDGMKRDSSPVSSFMPAIVTRALSDSDVHAVWFYTRHIGQ